MKVNLIGSGNLATQMGRQLVRMGVIVKTVYSRNIFNAKKLGDEINAKPIADFSILDQSVDLNIISVTDSAISEVQIGLPKNIPTVHTAGSIGKDELIGFDCYGILYPLQTFTKGFEVNFNKIPVFTEGNSSSFEEFLSSFSKKYLSERTYRASSDVRMKIHLSAVITSNFMNYFLGVAEGILGTEKIPLDILEELMRVTIEKSILNGPNNSITGPAARGDFQVLKKYENMILDSEFREVFKSLNKKISERDFNVL